MYGNSGFVPFNEIIIWLGGEDMNLSLIDIHLSYCLIKILFFWQSLFFIKATGQSVLSISFWTRNNKE